MDRYHMQSIEQILAELSLPHPLLEIAMGCGDQANIDRLRPATDRGDHALLKGPENLRLHADIHVADLIEKQRSALGFTKRTFPVAGCPGEGATHMAKQLAFHELGGNGSAIYCDKRLGRAMAVLVDRPRHELFARPG